MNFQLIPCFLDAFVFSCVLMFHCCLVVFVCFSYGNFFCMRLCVSFVLLAPLFSGAVCICFFFRWILCILDVSVFSFVLLAPLFSRCVCLCLSDKVFLCHSIVV